MTMHTCPCSTLGPGPHDIEATHVNPKTCEHAEYVPATAIRDLVAENKALRNEHDACVKQVGHSLDCSRGVAPNREAEA